ASCRLRCADGAPASAWRATIIRWGGEAGIDAELRRRLPPRRENATRSGSIGIGVDGWIAGVGTGECQPARHLAESDPVFASRQPVKRYTARRGGHVGG